MGSDGNDQREEYRIGYGRPPRDTQFKKGQSGNPRGRSRGSKNLTTLLDQELEMKVVIRENGRQRRISKRQAAIKQFINKLVSGDPRFIPFLFKLMEKQDDNSPASEPMSFAGNEIIDPEDARKLQEAWKAIQETQQTAPDEEEANK
jgi:hypothetical protein